ncbi:PREDICTED: WASH complex subunit CCDC53 homolog [Dinoponera quadriceps]|uniref:WASH complex subunit CCDC53 homolog n=1 Tax=Dinoponera quadriceps TaxID=609295 RepID=A0A6P3WXD4_DINQU|nr:PREDICTED: WASH complex subunit CCDC53 homolog [Dinoponera quadriceps]
MSGYKIPIIEPTIDYTKVPPINQKRTVSFINHFITHTVTFLNKFALSCEEKLYEFENKLQKLEASLEILESRLSSIPGLEQEYRKESDNVNENNTSKSEEVEVRKVDEPDSNEIEPKDEGEKDEHAASKDPRYEKYFKMIHFGVPKQAVKLKMEQEGLDASVLDNPQQVVSIQRPSNNSENQDE